MLGPCIKVFKIFASKILKIIGGKTVLSHDYYINYIIYIKPANTGWTLDKSSLWSDKRPVN